MPWRALALAGVAETCFSPEMSPWDGAGSLETTTAPESEVPWVSRSAGCVQRKPGSFLTPASPRSCYVMSTFSRSAGPSHTRLDLQTRPLPQSPGTRTALQMSFVGNCFSLPFDLYSSFVA